MGSALHALERAGAPRSTGGRRAGGSAAPRGRRRCGHGTHAARGWRGTTKGVRGDRPRQALAATLRPPLHQPLPTPLSPGTCRTGGLPYQFGSASPKGSPKFSCEEGDAPHGEQRMQVDPAVAPLVGLVAQHRRLRVRSAVLVRGSSQAESEP